MVYYCLYNDYESFFFFFFILCYFNNNDYSYRHTLFIINNIPIINILIVSNEYILDTFHLFSIT